MTLLLRRTTARCAASRCRRALSSTTLASKIPGSTLLFENARTAVLSLDLSGSPIVNVGEALDGIDHVLLHWDGGGSTIRTEWSSDDPLRSSQSLAAGAPCRRSQEGSRCGRRRPLLSRDPRGQERPPQATYPAAARRAHSRQASREHRCSARSVRHSERRRAFAAARGGRQPCQKAPPSACATLWGPKQCPCE